LLALLLPLLAQDGPSPFAKSIAAAEADLAAGKNAEAREAIERALERDPRSREAWALRARWAEAVGDKDELVHALHQEVRLAVAQKAPPAQQAELRKKLEAVDPIAPELLDLASVFVAKLLPLADFYEKQKRPHAAIRIHKDVLALDPERTASEEAIKRISAAPDPSLAETAQKKDLLADVSDEWMRTFDKEHATWDARAKLEREHYTTQTDAGYAVLVRAAEAMEQMNAFYRQFFHYGADDGKKVSRIELWIFANRAEYLKKGSGPPADWSGGQFTGGSVETYVDDTGGFETMVGTLFHEAAHQFVSLATGAAGWLNEGLASFFEGTRILANGTVVMNLPANHRLFPLATRMEAGWMSDANDGIDPAAPSKSEPKKAPTFRIVLENRYAWGPPWYAPTWGVVYFLYNFQDPSDGRFVYRKSFREFVDKSGGRQGEKAVENFEKIVLANPAPATKGVAPSALGLPKTVDELDTVWKAWTLKLRDEQSGKREGKRPWLEWARHAITREDLGDALEFFEKGLVETPHDVDLLLEFARFLAAKRKETDRATKLAREAASILESNDKPDAKAIAEADKLLAKWDLKHAEAQRVQSELRAAARSLARRYLDNGFPLAAMDLSARLGQSLGIPDLWDTYAEASKRSNKSPWIWKLAYNEHDLAGWLASATESWNAEGPVLRAKLGEFAEGKFEYRFLTLDTVTSGDFSLEAEVAVEEKKTSFCGLVFGVKDGTTFHALVLFPSRSADPAKQKPPRSGYVDLTSFYGSENKTWRHNPVDTTIPPGTATERWHKMRLDVAGRTVDVWFDGSLVVSHEMPSLDVLRGSFGLINGPGEARFRNVRYLARPARDPGAAIERDIKIGKLKEKAREEGTSLDGSWLGEEPPFPGKAKWIQSPRKSWKEKGRVPTLLVFWDTSQNERIPVNGWLGALAQQKAAIGLQIVSIASWKDENALAKYLETHPFPGSVALDNHAKTFFGEAFEAYAIAKFNLPRVILLDVDGRVAWEGDPGFQIDNPWQPGQETYLDAALDELAGKRKLAATIPWRAKWKESGEAAIRSGDVEHALPLLREARDLDATDPDVIAATGPLETLEAAAGSLETIAKTLTRLEREAALPALMTWAEQIGKPADATTKRALASTLGSPRLKEWKAATDEIAKAKKALKAGQEIATARALAEKLAPMTGLFPKELADELRAAADSGDPARATAAITSADKLPGRWLAREHFHW
ncbi:MAG TPA: family 16 glycoside hydrolase, partial [Planctomycetota bacterium]|nr:family 16 glycoside hydrolase [Planctomycetota bacterium]